MLLRNVIGLLNSRVVGVVIIIVVGESDRKELEDCCMIVTIWLTIIIILSHNLF